MVYAYGSTASPTIAPVFELGQRVFLGVLPVTKNGENSDSMSSISNLLVVMMGGKSLIRNFTWLD